MFRRLARRYDEDLVLFGHSHVQFDRTVAGTRFCNPGSVGQPRLGDSRARYAVVDDGSTRFEAVEYDAERTVAAMQTLPLPGEFVAARNEVYREGRLPDRYGLRDLDPLREMGYR